MLAFLTFCFPVFLLAGVLAMERFERSLIYSGPDDR